MSLTNDFCCFWKNEEGKAVSRKLSAFRMVLELLASSFQRQEKRHPSMLLAGILGRTSVEIADKRLWQ
ncbi:hypothetical protein BCT12_12680 [Vibrio breoganii]|nr:hypothetical protein BCT12_12680 [Vibrio breoganii]